MISAVQSSVQAGLRSRDAVSAEAELGRRRELTFAAVRMEIVADCSGNGVGIGHVYDNESITVVQCLCEAVGRATGAAEGDDRGFGCEVTFHLRESLFAPAGDKRDDWPSPT